MPVQDQSTDIANPELLSAFVEYTPAAVAMLDRDLRYLLTSRRWLADYALENQNLVGRSHYEVFPLFQSEEMGSTREGENGSYLGAGEQRRNLPLHPLPLSPPHLLERWQEVYALCLAGETQRGDSDYFIRPDGSRATVKWEIQPWRTRSGEIGGVIMFTEFQEPRVAEASVDESEEGYRRIRETATEGIWGSASLTMTIQQLQQEIAERKQAQALLQESEERYRSLIAAMAEGIVLEDANGVVRTWNVAAERILGLSVEQLMGRTSIDPRWRAIMEDGEPFPREEQPIAVTLRTGQPLTDVVMGIHKPDGTLTWVSVNSQPLFRPNETTPYAAVASFNDITNRKRIGAALRESEQRFRATFEQAAVGISHASREGKFVRVNQKFCDIIGYTREELLERTFQDITHPDDIQVTLEYVRSLLAGEIETYSLDKRYLRKDGESIWVQLTASLVRTRQGAPKYFLCVVQDISDRKAAESALRHSEAQLRERAQREELLNRLSSQIRNSLELNTILETTTQEIRQMLQIDRCQFAWYRPYDQEETGNWGLGTGESGNDERATMNDSAGVATLGASEQNYSSSGIHHSSLRTSPQSLAPSPSEARAYWEVVREARNPDFPDLTGCYPAEVVGPLAEPLLNLEILRVDDIETVSDPIFLKFMRSLGHISVLVLPMQTPSGTIGVINCSHSSEARPWSDSEVELLQAVKDQLLIAIQQADLYAASRKATQQAQEQATQLEQTLHELQLTQAQLIQSEKMSSLGQLVAGVAHEINNPVNFIYGNLIYAQEYCQDLLGLVQLYRSAYPNPPAQIKQRIDAIDLDFLMSDLTQLQDSMKVGAERIREIVRSLRTFSRIDESGCKEVDIHSGIESTLMILQHRLKAKPGHAAISVIKEYGDLPLVECSPGQLNQVFLNLLTNAIDALEEKMNPQQLEAMAHQSETSTHPPPTITITTGLVERDYTGEGEIRRRDSNGTADSHVFIRIADNGLGMTQKIQQQLFDPFFTTKPVGKGTGLGLSISYQIIVEKHSGQLRCNSAPGQGAEFVVEIPIRQGQRKG